MQINFRDVSLCYAIAFFLSPILAFIGIHLQDSIFFYVLEALLFAIPLGYYFTKNHSNEAQTAVVATIIGFTLVPFTLIPAALLNFRLTDFIFFIEIGAFTLPLKIAMNGILTISASLLMWYANKNLIPKIKLSM